MILPKARFRGTRADQAHGLHAADGAVVEGAGDYLLGRLKSYWLKAILLEVRQRIPDNE
jgi:hypothetical protein